MVELESMSSTTTCCESQRRFGSCASAQNWSKPAIAGSTRETYCRVKSSFELSDFFLCNPNPSGTVGLPEKSANHVLLQ